MFNPGRKARVLFSHTCWQIAAVGDRNAGFDERCGLKIVILSVQQVLRPRSDARMGATAPCRTLLVGLGPVFY